MPVIPVPFADPAAAFAPFAGEDWAMLLDGARAGDARARHAYIAIRPYRTVLSRDGRTEIDGRPVAIEPFAALTRILAEAPAAVAAPVPFAGGAVGWLGYELGRHLERAPARHAALPDRPEMAMGLYDSVAAFDLERRRAWVITTRPDAAAKAEILAAAIGAARPLADPTPLALDWRPEMERAAYLAGVRRAIGLIHAGDVFQVNLTTRQRAARPPDFDDFALYRRLCAVNPAPFAAYLRAGPGAVVASASPERFLALTADGRIEARPIKGTRARATDAAGDAAAAAALAASAKDRSENLMIVDLLRNDIGRVAALGSVRVPVLYGVESTKGLHHLVSVVEGRLRPGLGPVDLLRAAFPGGSITGAPKVRAMEIIDELEPSPRGPYCGVALWIGFDGAMDSSILIRTLVVAGDEIIAQAGGGIVAESDPESEYAEMMAKLAPALAV